MSKLELKWSLKLRDNNGRKTLFTRQVVCFQLLEFETRIQFKCFSENCLLSNKKLHYLSHFSKCFINSSPLLVTKLVFMLTILFIIIVITNSDHVPGGLKLFLCIWNPHKFVQQRFFMILFFWGGNQVSKWEYRSNKRLKTLDTIGNCRRPVSSLGVSQHNA